MVISAKSPSLPLPISICAMQLVELELLLKEDVQDEASNWGGR